MSLRIFPLIASILALVFATAAGAAPGDEVVLLSRGDIVITRGDFMYMLETAVPEGSRATVLADNQKVRQMIADLFVIRQLAADARQAGLDKDPLVSFKVSVNADRALMDSLLDKAVASAAKPDFEKSAREIYTANQQRFFEPERVRVSHILIAVKEGRTGEMAKQLAEEVRKQALEGKKSFEELAQEFSDDKSVKTNKGDLGFFEHDRMVKPFADAAFAMHEPGEISPVVESQFGFHIIKFIDRKPERQQSFDEVKRGIMDREEQKYTSKLRLEKIEQAKSLDGIKVNQEAVSALSAQAKDAGTAAAAKAKAAAAGQPKKDAP